MNRLEAKNNTMCFYIFKMNYAGAFYMLNLDADLKDSQDKTKQIQFFLCCYLIFPAYDVPDLLVITL